jgi:hypothetical protein
MGGLDEFFESSLTVLGQKLNNYELLGIKHEGELFEELNLSNALFR